MSLNDVSILPPVFPSSFPLTITSKKAYDLVKKGEELISKKQFKDASIRYKEASELFQKQIGQTDNEEVNNALRILVDQNARRASELSLLQNRKPQIKAQPVVPMPSTQSNPSVQSSQHVRARGRDGGDSITASLASARGMDSGSGVDDNDPIAKFQVQVYNLIKINPSTTQDQPIDLSNTRIRPSGKSIEELELENATLKQLLSNYSENLHTYESFHKKLKINLKNYLNTLKNDLQIQEKRKQSQFDQKLELLNKENKSLDLQVKKLKERWNDLVESARKRREDINTNQNKK
ncbi:Kinesin-like protein [Wickerhamomyces ciferrii]|uniref:Kinesin-like protein n=1 Tax=Wickerhamomyces ciferrii (strain ATCC 14091 / BCRC 22168 / CBS 111 / JCM 3599 / NBRC 0793 / NRRL Y-1031 F-60-10) TaxID=1206466 RepID=K0KT77_WICCF|nr:Kinesin-like protein [Wickerhamomyces ciferrii]CCH44574.1 Kinesin-like protein [Wickerhamomyces ciferrii]